MAILFRDIYSKAIALFDEPKITIAYKSNKIQFSKLMYPFLRDSFALLTNPQQIAQELVSEVIPPIGQMEIFEGDGTKQIFETNLNPPEDALLEFKIDGVVVSGEYNRESKTVDFGEVVGVNKICSFEYYSEGQFNTDLNVTNNIKTNKSIKAQTEDILCRLLVKAWAESKRNFALDIQNILTDTDFKLHPASAVLRSKNEWVNQLDTEICLYQNKMATLIRFSNGANWGKRVW